MSNLFRAFIATLACIVILFVAVSLLDILIAVIYDRFYSTIAFIVTFAVGGIFAAVMGYMAAIEQLEYQARQFRGLIIFFQIATGLLFFFVLARLEGGEYEAAFKGFGATLAAGSLLFISDRKR